MRNFLYSIVTFIFALFLFLLGIIGVMMPWSATMRTLFIAFILEDSLAISLFGFTLIIIGAVIAAYILLSAKRHYYYVRSGDKAVAVDEQVLRQYLSNYWKQLFPAIEIPTRLVLKNNKIYISADLPFFPQEQQRSLLERVKNDLKTTFAKTLGYHDEFYLYASFESESSKV